MGSVLGGIPIVGDLIAGKKDPGQAAQNIDLRTAQEKGLQAQALGQYGQILGKDTSAMASQQIAEQEQQARQSAADQETRARQMVAQRGLGNTAMGMNAILGQQAGLGEKIGSIRGQRLGLENQLQQQNLGFATQGLGALSSARSGSQIYQQAVASKGRQGGLMPLIGGAAGAYLGGPAGAQVGMGLGQAASQV